MHGRRYLFRVGTMAAMVLAAAGLLNAAVDPYGLFAWVEAPGINAKKAEAHRHARLAKQERAARARPRTVLIGNSRVDVGLDPASPVWPGPMRPVVNLGVPGEGIGGTAVSYAFARGQTPAETILIGLDFADFLIADPAMPVPAPQWKMLPQVALSTSAVVDSIRTLMVQRTAYSAEMTALGFNPMRDHAAIVAAEGHFALADQKNRQNFRTLTSRAETVRQADGVPGRALRILDEIIAAASRDGIRTVLVIYPLHAQFLQSIALSGRWPAYADWKRAVVASVARHRAARPDWQSSVWDFGVFAAETEEPVPPAGAAGEMRWWWEPGHFKAALGERLAAQIFRAMPGFGRRLSPENVDGHLAREDRRRQAYADANPAVIAYLQGLCAPGACPPAMLAMR